jgi:hypothetical protein
MAMMPDVPGMRMRVTPKTGEVVIHDPLDKTPEVVDQITAVRKRAEGGFDGKFVAVKTEKKTLEADQMVTLLWELRRAVDMDKTVVDVVSGQVPTEEQINAMPGDELTDYGYIQPGQPKYVKDRDQHAKVLAAMRQAGVAI